MRITLILVGIFLVLNASVLAFTTNFNFGIVITLLFGALAFMWGVYFKKIGEITSFGFLKGLKYLVITGILFLLCMITFITIYGNTDTVTFEEDAIIVLGAGIKGETITLTLKYRLDKAYEYYTKNQDIYLVLSGGQGFQEDITEALAMERYLIGKGIPKEKIIKEENATSTFENFVYSKEILDDHFKGQYKTAFITNNFHIYRASKIASLAGLKSTHYHAKIQWYTMSVNYLRECAAILKLWILKN